MSITVQESFALLGLSSDATPEEIKRQYRVLARKYHPDVNGHLSGEELKECESTFKKISEAYEILADPVKRAHATSYDSPTSWGSAFGFDSWEPPRSEPIVVPDPEIVVCNGVNIRVEYNIERDNYSSFDSYYRYDSYVHYSVTEYLYATLFVDLGDLSDDLETIWQTVAYFSQIKAPIHKWWAMNGDTRLFEFTSPYTFHRAHERWLEEEKKKTKKQLFYDRLAPLKQELRRLQALGRPTATLESLVQEVDHSIYLLHEGWSGTSETEVMRDLRAAEKELARIKEGGLDLLLDDLLNGKIAHKDALRNKGIIDQVKIWSIRTGGFVDMITPESLRDFYSAKLKGLTRVDELEECDLTLDIADYDPTPLLDELDYAPDTVEIQGRKAMVSYIVTYDLYEVDGELVPVGVITVALTTYERNAAEYGKRSQFPELPYDIRLLIQVTVDGKIIATGFDDKNLADRITKFKKSRNRGKAVAGVGVGDWSGRRWEPIGPTVAPPWAKGQAARSRWR